MRSLILLLCLNAAPLVGQIPCIGCSGGGGGSGVSSVSGTAPIVSSGGATPAISVTVGTGPGTVAAGNDSRFVAAPNAVVSHTFSGAGTFNYVHSRNTLTPVISCLNTGTNLYEAPGLAAVDVNTTAVTVAQAETLSCAFNATGGTGPAGPVGPTGPGGQGQTNPTIAHTYSGAGSFSFVHSLNTSNPLYQCYNGTAPYAPSAATVVDVNTVSITVSGAVTITCAFNAGSGTQGPQGTTGPQGPTGPIGPTGANGGAQQGTRASLPATTGLTTGAVYKCNGGCPYEYIFDGTIWQPYVFGFNVVEPVLANFSVPVNQGGSTLTNTNGGVTLLAPANSGDNLRMYMLGSYPATPFVFDVAFMPSMTDATYFFAGIITRSTSTGQTVSVGTTNGHQTVMVHWNSNTSLNSQVGASNYTQGLMIWFRYADNGTTRTTSWSSDGTYWNQVGSESNTAFVTTNQLGLFANVNNAAYGASVPFYHAYLH